MTPCVAIALPVGGHLWHRENAAVSALGEIRLGRGHQTTTGVTQNIPEGALSQPGNPATTAPETAPTSSRPPVDAVAAVDGGLWHAQQQEEGQRSPLGWMFRPELTKEGVVMVVSQVLCQPGFTLGVSDERRLLKSVKTGRIDIRTMSRMLRWLAGDRAARELRRRGIEFVGPTQMTVSSPYTTGQGMTQLVNEIIAGNKAGTRFIVCFSSRFDACSSAIAGVLVDSASPAAESAVDCCGGGVFNEDARTVSTCSSFSDTAEDDDRTAPCSTPISVDLVPDARRAGAPKGEGGTASGYGSRFVGVGGVKAGGISSVVGERTSAKRTSRDDCSPRGGVVALLLDEKPKHRLCNGGGGGGGDGNSGTAGICGVGGGVYGMPVEEWVEAYGECDGPMLAAWVFPGQGL